MGGIISKPKIPDTSAQQKAQAEAMEKQTALLDSKKPGLKRKSNQRGKAQPLHQPGHGAEVVGLIVCCCLQPVVVRLRQASKALGPRLVRKFKKVPKDKKSGVPKKYISGSKNPDKPGAERS